MKSAQYTIRNIPAALDAKLRARARREKKSLNRLVIEQLHQSVSGTITSTTDHHDYDHYINSWVVDLGFDNAMKDMRLVDPNDW